LLVGKPGQRLKRRAAINAFLCAYACAGGGGYQESDGARVIDAILAAVREDLAYREVREREGR
jgi:hypothetical protein